jgi:hypothetical protein
MLTVTVYTIDNPSAYEPGDTIDCATVECIAPVIFRQFATDDDAMAYAAQQAEETGQNIARIITRD